MNDDGAATSEVLSRHRGVRSGPSSAVQASARRGAGTPRDAREDERSTHLAEATAWTATTRRAGAARALSCAGATMREEAATRAGIFWTVDGALAWSACVAGRRRGGRFRLRDERSCDDELDVGARGNATRQAPRSS